MSYVYDNEVSTSITWDMATRTWDSALYTWDSPGSGFSYDNETGLFWENWETIWDEETRTWDELEATATQTYDSESVLYSGEVIPDMIIGDSFIIRDDNSQLYTYDEKS